MNNGLGVPFIDVSFSGLLWGYEGIYTISRNFCWQNFKLIYCFIFCYEDELPCLKLSVPSGCSEDEDDDGWGDDDDGMEMFFF